MARFVEFEVSPEEAGMRLDKILVRRFPELGRKRARELCLAGRVAVEGRPAPKAALPSVGARVSFELEGARSAVAEAGFLDVLLERPELVVVNKPAGQPSAVLRGDERGAVVNALLARYPEMRDVGFHAREPGLVHRLDTQTSGVLLAARTREAFDALREAIESEGLTKRYLALVESQSIGAAGEIDAWLGPHPKNPRRVASFRAGHPAARPARSTYRVLRRSGRWALVEVEACRAYRHQVRAHLALRGSPIAGDALYGGPELPLLGARHALHASHVSFPGPFPEAFTVEAPLPPEFERALEESAP